MMRFEGSAMSSLPRWLVVLGESPLFGSGHLQDMLQALCLGCQDALTKVGEPVVAPSLVIECWIRAFIPLDNQSLGKHLLDRTVECPWPKANFPLSRAVHLLHNAVAMMITTDE